MGSPIARSLAEHGYDITVWNRSLEKAEALAEAGAHPTATAAEAVAGRDVVFTVLTDDPATEAVVFGAKDEPGILTSLKQGATHVSLSTISVRLARRLEASHAERGQFFVGAPVFGRPNVAREGKLWVVAAGPQPVMEEVAPVLRSISRGLTILSEEPWQAHALKLGGNLLITTMIQSLGEAFVYARSQGIDPAVFHQTVNDALFQSRMYENYGKTMLNPPEHPGATVHLGAKDTRLVREAAADANTRIGLADYCAEVFHRAEEAGLSDVDWAVGQYRIAERDGALS